MAFAKLSSPGWALTLLTLLTAITATVAYRPVQHCKMLFDNGHYSACAALTHTYNASSGVSDLYVRYHWYRYENTNKGWHAFAIGDQMAGALMLIMYGDPNTPEFPLTVSVRTADGHHPPQLIEDVSRYDDYWIPPVEIVTARFEEYRGEYVQQKINKKPTHVGITEAIIRGFTRWPGTKADNKTTNQPFLWSSNSDTEYDGDYSASRSIKMHQFGQGFGFLWVDLLNAETPYPVFGAIDELAGISGLSEVSPTFDAPTAKELEIGQAYLDAHPFTPLAGTPANSIINGNPTEPTASPSATPSKAEQDIADDAAKSNDGGIPPPANTGSPQTEAQTPPIQQPAKTIMGKTLRDWMWHLHGFFMTLSFLVLYPLGTYLLRRPTTTGSGSGFNSHWTIQSLGSISLLVGAAIGYVNSYGISVTHQYLGIFLVVLVIVQILLGYRHHVVFVATKRRTLISTMHVWTGRFILPLGWLNMILGMLLRRYGWFTLTLVLVFVTLEAAFLIYVLRSIKKNRGATGLRNKANEEAAAAMALRREEAEEYFQLEGDDDDDDFDSDIDDESSAVKKQEEKRSQAERLAKLDRV